MANNPPIEVLWGGGAWRKCQRAPIRPVVDQAIDLTATAVTETGLGYHHPKRLTIWRCSRGATLMGASDGPTDIELYFRVDHIKHRKIANMLIEVVLATGHELVHAIRSEWHNDKTLGEHVASEGLAYVGEGILGEVVIGEKEPKVADFIIEEGLRVDYEALKKKLRADQYYMYNGEPVDVHDAWLGLDGRELAPGLIVGVTEVSRRLAEGNEFADVLRWPMEEILDLGNLRAQG